MNKVLTTAMLVCTASVAFSAEITLTPSLSDITTSTTDSLSNTTNYSDSFVTPEVNIGNGGTWTWTASFTLNEASTIDSIQMALFTFSSSGNPQYEKRAGAYTITITPEGSSKTYTSNSQAVTYNGLGKEHNPSGVTINNEGGNTEASYTFSSPTEGSISNSSGLLVSYTPSNWGELAAGNYTFTLSVNEGTTNPSGYYLGVGGARINTSVPEPTTATLSLLALAGLAARRRRK